MVTIATAGAMGPGAWSWAAGVAALAPGSLEGALIGGVTAAAFSGVGGAFGAPGKLGAIGKGIARLTVNFSVNATSAVFYGLKTLAHGIVGGLSSKLSGGSFSKSFLSSAIVNALAPSIGKFGSKLGYYGDIAAAALVGGIASKLVGGEFASGAMLGAFAYWFNHKLHRRDAVRLAKDRVNQAEALLKPLDDWVKSHDDITHPNYSTVESMRTDLRVIIARDGSFAAGNIARDSLGAVYSLPSKNIFVQLGKYIANFLPSYVGYDYSWSTSVTCDWSSNICSSQNNHNHSE